MGTEHVSLPDELQVFHRPEVFLGSSKVGAARRLLYKNGQMVPRNMMVSHALQHMTTEIMMNASDNKVRSVARGIKPGEIDIKVDSTTVEITNGGAAMPVDYMESADGKQVYVPSEMYERCGSGSNYDDSVERFTAGKNGVGAGAVVALSTYVRLEVVDTDRGKHFVQEWTKPDYNPKLCGDSMSVSVLRKIGRRATTGPVVTELDDNVPRQNMVKATFTAAFERFGLTGYDEEWISMLHADAHFLAYCTEIPVIYNGERIDYSTTTKRAKLYTILGVTKYHEITTSSYKETAKTEPEHVAEWNITFFPDSGLLPISFVNGTPTRNGGKHHNNLANAISRVVCEQVAKDVYPDDDAKRKDLVSTIVKNNISYLMKLTVSKPEFDNQNKEKLDTETYIPVIEAEDFDCFKFKEKVIERYKKELMDSANKKIAKLKANKTKPANLVDSNCVAAGRRDLRNTLNPMEGNSAQKYADYGLRDPQYNGFLPLRGKLLNVNEMDAERVMKNEVCKSIILAVGFEFGKDYSIPAERAKLRYPNIRICTDADPDGYHIQCLFINFVATFWPGYIIAGGLKILRSPIRRARRGKEYMTFYTNEEYEEWAKTSGNGWTIKYCKGLANNDPSDIIYDFRNGVTESVLILDEDALTNLDKAFCKSATNVRKKILLDTSLQGEIPWKKALTITQLIMTGWRSFSLYNAVRAIPAFPDGLKPGERKILYVMFKKYKNKSIKDEDNTAKIGVNALGGAVIEDANYHHGENSLYKTITKMARGYPGSSSAPLFYPSGDFGSRWLLGDDGGAARYLQTYPRVYAKLIFRPEDDNEDILPFTIDEDRGTRLEPDFYLPIIPLQLVNVPRGTGTGWSTFIPSYDLIEVIDQLLDMLDGYKPAMITPKYRYYNGNIYTYINGRTDVPVENITMKRDKVEPEDVDERFGDYEGEQDGEWEDEADYRDEEGATEIISTTARSHIEIQGDYELFELKDGGLQVEIYDIPPGIAYKSVFKHYDMLKEKGFMSRYDRGSGYFHFRCTVYLTSAARKDFREGIEKVDAADHDAYTIYRMENMLMLRSVETLNNMYLIDPDTKLPTKYKDVVDILTKFYDFRLPWYDVRKESMTKDLKVTKYKLEEQLKLLDAIDAGDVCLYYDDGKAKPSGLVNKELVAAGIDHKVVDLRTTSHSDLEYDRCVKSLDATNNEIAQMMEIDPRDLWRNDLLELRAKVDEYFSGVTIDEKMDKLIAEVDSKNSKSVRK